MNDQMDASEPTYKIVRHYYDSPEGNKTLKTGLTRAEAQEHCNDSEASSRTASVQDPDAGGMPWFDGFEEE
jgi:hypothetical protein